MAQNVYSVNVVGYVNVTLPGNYLFTCVANPLDASMGGTVPQGNNITNLFNNVPPGTYFLTWNPATFDWYSTVYSTADGTGAGWNFDYQLPPGQAVFISSPAASPATVTFVGEVVQGPYYSSALMGGYAFNLIGMPVPVGGSVTNVNYLGLAPSAGDSIYKWDPTGGGGFGDFYSTVEAWNGAAWSPATTTFDPGEGFFYSAVATNNWYSNFTVE